MTRKELTLYSLLTLLALSLAFAGGYLAHEWINKGDQPFPVLNQAHDLLLNNAYDPVSPDDKLEYGMIRGMLVAYGDRFTSFNEPAVHELQTNSLEGTFGGIGVRLDRDPEGFIILYPIPNGPAELAGIVNADRLLKVDQSEIRPETPFDEVQAAIRGLEGTAVEILIERSGNGEQVTYSIKREPVALPSVTWHLVPFEPEVGVIEVNLIADTTQEEILAAVESMRADGASHFILDLRDNGGGLLEAGIDVARLFLSDGIVIHQQYRGEAVKVFEVEDPGDLAGLPLVILVNHHTASAAEIVAGALQANARAPLIGSSTFGKDVIQLVFELQDGSSLQVSAARWWFPGLEFPGDGFGLAPDIPIENTREEGNAEVLRNAIDLLLEE